MKSRRWIAAAALAAAVVFLVMVTGERAPVEPAAAPAPVSSSEAVLASDGGPPDDGAEGAEGADRDEIIDALQGLLDALGISPEELADCNAGDNGNGGGDNGNGNGNGNGEDAQSEDSEGGGCEKSEPANEPVGSATITIAGFAFGQPLTVAPGTRIEVVNTDAAPHNVTASDGSFETPDLNQGDKATITAPSAPGRYEFTCTLHPEMTGTLIVEAEGNGGNGGDQDRGRSTAPSSDSQRSGGSGGDHERNGQHETTAPSRGGSSDGY